MKEFMSKLVKYSAVAMVSFAALVATIFAAAPCIGSIYEPKLPEELRK